MSDEQPTPDPSQRPPQQRAPKQRPPQHHVPLTVLPSSGKVDQLRQEAAAAAAKPQAGAAATPQAGAAPPSGGDTLVSRFCDQNKSARQKAIEEKVIDACRLVYDPEIPVNIYDLGLIYGIEVDDRSGAVKVRMTLTAPGCPVAGELVASVQRRAQAIEEVPEASVELVWEPPWTRERMSEAAQLELGLL